MLSRTYQAYQGLLGESKKEDGRYMRFETGSVLSALSKQGGDKYGQLGIRYLQGMSDYKKRRYLKS